MNQLQYGWGYTLGSGLGEGKGFGTHFVPGQVPAVGPEGVWIGNSIGGPLGYLNGNIQSVKIWRADPQTMIKKFLRRPFTSSQLECWGNFIRKLNEVSSQSPDPECAEWRATAIGSVHDEFLQKLAQKSPEKVAEFWAFCEAYQALWAGGKVGSTEMKDLMARLRDWLKNEQLFSSDDPKLRAILQHPCMTNFTAAVGGLECDADAQTLLKAILGV